MEKDLYPYTKSFSHGGTSARGFGGGGGHSTVLFDNTLFWPSLWSRFILENGTNLVRNYGLVLQKIKYYGIPRPQVMDNQLISDGLQALQC